jgi:hypothetical protein
MTKLPDTLYKNGDPESPIMPELKKPLGRCITTMEIRNWVRDYLFFTYVDIDGTRMLSPKYPVVSRYSNNSRIYFYCKGAESCKWHMVVAKSDKDKMWRVSKLLDQHDNCVVDIKEVTKSLSYNALKRIVFNNNIAIQDATSAKHLKQIAVSKGLDFNAISLTKIYKAKNTILLERKEPFYIGFTLLKSYLQNLAEANPGSIIQLEVVKDINGTPRFNRLFVMFPATVNIVTNGCKPVVSFDAAFTKFDGWNNFQLLFAGTIMTHHMSFCT